MNCVKGNKNILAMFIFIMLFEFSEILTIVSTANNIDVILVAMILLPIMYLMYQINRLEIELPNYIKLIAVSSASMYIVYGFVNIIIDILSFLNLNVKLYQVYSNKILIFILASLIILILNNLQISKLSFERIIVVIFGLSTLILGYLIVSLTLGTSIVVNLVRFDVSYTNLVAIFFPVLYLTLIKCEKKIIGESIFLGTIGYIMVLLIIMLVGNFVVYSNSSVMFVNVAFTNFIKDNTEQLFGNFIFIVFIVTSIFKISSLYIIATSSYRQSKNCSSNKTIAISLAWICATYLFSLVGSDNLWTMKELIQAVFVILNVIFIITLAGYGLYLSFSTYITPFAKGLLLVVSTFPIIACIFYLAYINSPLFYTFSKLISRLNIIFLLFSIVVLIYYSLETVLLLYGYHKRLDTSEIEVNDNNQQMDIFVLIPCLNEDLVIYNTLSSLLANDYQKLHVYVIDDASSDNTLFEIARSRDIRKHVLKRRKPNAQTGKGEALNWAYYQLLTVINDQRLNHDQVLITIIDADTEIDNDYFNKVNKVFTAMPEVTGLQSKVRVVELGADSAQDLEFAQIINSMQSLRNLTHTVAFGGNGQFCKLSILEQLNQKPWSDSLVEDFDLSTRLYLELGAEIYNVQFDDIYIKQSGIVNNAPALVKQRVRWAQGNVQSAKYFKAIILSTKLKLIQKIELCSTLIKPWLMAIEYAILIYTLVLIVDVYLVEGLSKVLVLVVVLFILMTLYILLINLIWSILYNLEKSQKVKLKSIVIDTIYLTKFLFTLTQIYPQSILKHLKRDNGWDKTKRQTTN